VSTTAESETWEEISGWLDTYLDDRPLVDILEATETLEGAWVEGQWEQLDPWWEVNVESQGEALAELQEVLDSTGQVWQEADCSMDEDPLVADWATNHRSGPLRINQEENWSQWLAHVIRSGPSEFSRELFGDEFDVRPRSVEREVHLVDHGGTDRYADIVLYYVGRGISIEVKRGDSHYSKTTHTASLIESQRAGNWEHFLLLPEYKTDTLRQSFGNDLEEPAEGRPFIRSDQSDDVTVLYWQEVSEAIRNVLLDGPETGSHWEASAYLLCTLVEQKVAQFLPKSTVEEATTASDIVSTASSARLAGTDIERQVAYLRRTMGRDNHE